MSPDAPELNGVDVWGAPIRKRPMTILAGVIAARSIVIASDTQETSDDETAWKLLDSAKIEILKIGGTEALVAVSGITDLTLRFLQRIHRDAESVEIRNQYTVMELAERTMEWLRRDQQKALGMSGHAFREHLLKHRPSCSVMLAYFFGDAPFLYQIRFATARATSDKRNYLALGSGSIIGQYLLHENILSYMSRDYAMVVAIHAVQGAKNHADGCGGETNVALIEYKPDWWKVGSGTTRAIHVKPERVRELSSLISKVEARTKKLRNDKLQRILTKGMVKRIADALLERKANESTK